jgi:hypothetical protein
MTTRSDGGGTRWSRARLTLGEREERGRMTRRRVRMVMVVVMDMDGMAVKMDDMVAVGGVGD